MNVLAHLHLATLANSSIIGNAAADFVKGDPYKLYENTIADGIMMHRRLDKLIDGLAEVKQAKSLFVPEHQRVASITLDIVWDHFLSKYWQRYNPKQDITTFNQEIQVKIELDIQLFPDEFKYFMSHLSQGEWLANYANIDFIGKVLNGMANRHPKLDTLRYTFDDIKQNYPQLETLFLQFYPELMLKASCHQL